MKIKCIWVLMMLCGILPLQAQDNKADVLARDVYVWPFEDINNPLIPRYTDKARELTEIFELELSKRYRANVLNQVGRRFKQLEAQFEQTQLIEQKLRGSLETNQLLKDFFQVARRVVFGDLKLRNQPGEKPGTTHLLSIRFQHLYAFRIEAQGEIYIKEEDFLDRERIKKLVSSLIDNLFREYLEKNVKSEYVIITGRIKDTYEKPISIRIQELPSYKFESDRIGLFQIQFPREELYKGDQVTLLFEDNYRKLDTIIPLNNSRRIDLNEEIRIQIEEYFKITFTGLVVEERSDKLATNFDLGLKNSGGQKIEIDGEPQPSGQFKFQVYYKDIKDSPHLIFQIIPQNPQEYEIINQKTYGEEQLEEFIRKGEAINLGRFTLKRKQHTLEKHHISVLWLGRIIQGEDFDLGWLTGAQFAYHKRIGSDISRVLAGLSLRYLLDKQRVNYDILSEPIEEIRQAHNLYLGLALRYVWSYRKITSSYIELNLENQFYTKQNLSTFLADNSVTFFNEIRPYIQLKAGWSQSLGYTSPLSLNFEIGYFLYSTNVPSIQFNEFGNAQADIEAQNKLIQGLSVQAGLAIRWPFK